MSPFINVSNESSRLKKIKRGSASFIFYTATHKNPPPPQKKKKKKKRKKEKAKAI
jgi:hypothetical protein